jgi:hypothetical protein
MIARYLKPTLSAPRQKFLYLSVHPPINIPDLSTYPKSACDGLACAAMAAKKRLNLFSPLLFCVSFINPHKLHGEYLCPLFFVLLRLQATADFYVKERIVQKYS